MEKLIINFDKNKSCTFEEGCCRCLKTNITDRILKTYISQESLKKGSILYQIHKAESIIIDGAYLTITTANYCLSVTLEND